MDGFYSPKKGIYAMDYNLNKSVIVYIFGVYGKQNTPTYGYR